MVELDCRRLDLPANLAEQYAPQVAAALAQMKRVEEGERVNVDEERMVGHYWLRRPGLTTQPEAKGVDSAVKAAIEKIDKFVAGPGRVFSRFLLDGIGGSALGPEFLDRAFRTHETKPIHFFDNTDPEGFVRTLRDIGGRLGETLTIVISKSGGTPETRNGLRVAQAAYRAANVDFASHAVAVTEPGSKLEKEAAGWLERFPIWDWVGGRTSMFSAVGLLPAALLGFDWKGLRNGAAEMDGRTGPKVSDPERNPALKLALAWHHLIGRRGLHHMVVLPYSDRLSLLASYLQQLVMESLGKDGKGLAVFGNKGSTDQHSYVQQLRDGRPDFFAGFVRVLVHTHDPVADVEVDPKDEPGITSADYLAAYQEATAKALHEAGRPSFRITLDEVSEQNVGAVVALFERAVGYYAPMIAINAYHQPGVEAGKKAGTDYLRKQRKLVAMLRGHAGKAWDGRELVDAYVPDDDKGKVEEKPTADLAADILMRLAANGRFGIKQKGEQFFIG